MEDTVHPALTELVAEFIEQGHPATLDIEPNEQTGIPSYTLAVSIPDQSDFLYQVEWQELIKNGVLSRLDLAFSRDAAPKTYVQDRLRRQGRDVYAWLEEGAYLYVCGDSAHMAPDVHAALTDIVAEHGGLDRDEAGAYLSALQRDRRYRLDVY